MTFTRIAPLLLGFGLSALACSSDPAASGDTEDPTGSGGDAQAGSGGTQVGNAGSDVTAGSGGSVVAGTGGAAGSVGSGGSAGKGGTGGSIGVGGGGGGGVMGAAGPRFIGRFEDAPGLDGGIAHQSAWSGSAIELRFTGTDLSVAMSGGNFWYEVAVDNTAPVKKQIGATTMLATGLAAGPHFVQMVRRAEAFNGIAKFLSFSVPDSAILPQQIPTRKIEVIGDSFAVAYGIDGCGDRTNGDENAYASWGWVLARMVKADVHIVAQSGVGMAFSLGGNPTIPTIYGNALGTQNPAKWDFSKYIPDAVLIDVGENDQNAKDTGGKNLYDVAKFKMVYGDFLTTLRTNYPNAYIYCGSHGDLSADIQALVTAKADAKIKYIKFDGTRTACDFHPDVAGHQAYATIAAAALKADLGWQ